MTAEAHPRRQRLLRPRLSFVTAEILFLILSFAISMRQISVVPGLDVHLGPLFYLMALNLFGLRAGLIAAALTMAPSILWWHHFMALIIALGQVMTISLFRSETRSAATISFFYHLATAGAALVIAALTPGATPIDALVIVLFRKVLLEWMLACLSDAAMLFLSPAEAGRPLRLRSLVSILGATQAICALAIAGSAVLMLMDTREAVIARLDAYRQVAEGTIASQALPEAAIGPRPYRIALPGYAIPASILPDDAPPSARNAACGALAPGAGGLWGSAGLDDLFAACWRGKARMADGAERGVLISAQSFARSLFEPMLASSVVIGLLVASVHLLLALLGGAVLAARGRLQDMIRLFGSDEIAPSASESILEGDILARAIATANDDFLAANRERLRLAKTIDELRSTIQLRLVSEIWFDPQASALRFVKLHPTQGRLNLEMSVHPADESLLQGLHGHNDVLVEFRGGGEANADWHLLLAHEYDANKKWWAQGCLIQLRTAKLVQSQMRHNARLMELGAMASALSHELRQPLFTILLAAENGSAMLADETPDLQALGRKFSRIVEQVDRASTIVQRVSHYSRIEHDEGGTADARQVVDDAVRFMHPILEERGITLRTHIPDPTPSIALQRVGIEQVLVNALQNAADAIEQKGDVGAERAIDIMVAQVDGELRIDVADTGAGISSEKAARPFDAFVTTKPAGKGTGLGLYICKQIMDECGGTITLKNKDSGDGAVLSLVFPGGDRMTTEGRT